MTGGVSHVDTFDPKPRLTADVGKEVKLDHPEIRNRPGYEQIFLKRPQWEFQPHGQCGTEVSALFPHVAGCVDDIAVIRSMHTDHSNHYNATLGMHTGSFAFARPSIGSWVSYGLGTENRNLPSFMVDRAAQTYAGTQVYASDFLPGAHQGTLVVPGDEPIANIRPRVEPPQQQTRTGGAGADERPAPGGPGRRSAAGRADQIVRDRLWHADGRARRVRPVARNRRDAAALRPGARQHAAASAGNAWSPGGWSSAACDSSN